MRFEHAEKVAGFGKQALKPSEHQHHPTECGNGGPPLVRIVFAPTRATRASVV
jgi:hypothetical protein